MPTEAKAAAIEQLTARLERMRAAVLLQTQGLTVVEMSELRRRLSGAGVELHVAKNTLLRIASERAQVADLAPILHGQTAIALGYADEVSVAKAVSDYMRTVRAVHPITIKAGILGRTPISADEVDALAKTPGRDQLRANVVGTIQGPMSDAFGVINAPLRELVNVLEARIHQLGGAAA